MMWSVRLGSMCGRDVEKYSLYTKDRRTDAIHRLLSGFAKKIRCKVKNYGDL